MTIKEHEKSLYALLEREVCVCQTALVEEAFRTQLFFLDDVSNFYRPFDGQLLSPAVCVICSGEFSCLDSENGQCQACYEENQQPQEICEWRLVSPWLSKKLLAEGEPVLDNKYGIWWGRCTQGQDISMDYVIRKIYDDIITYTG